jgi:hypothetical protein
LRFINLATKLFLMFCLMGISLLPAKVSAQEVPTIIFDLTTGETYVNEKPVTLEVPASLIEGRLYVPVRFLSEHLGFEVKWDGTTRTITITTKKVLITLQPDDNTAAINGKSVPFDHIGVIVKDNLLLSARTMSDYMNVQVDYNPIFKRVTLKEREPEVPKPTNAKPVAQFTTDKTVYRMGEPIHYIDVSYDPDANGYFPSWQGKQDAFFTPGEHEVTLTIKDTFGAISEPFSRTILVTNETLTTQAEYGFYFGAMEKDPRAIPIDMNRFRTIPILNPKETRDTSRKLIVSNSPETFKEYGILYEEKISEQYRLFATHINGMKKMAQFYVMVTNPTSEPVSIRTTHKGEVAPTAYPEILGTQGLVNWFLEGETDELRVLQPGESFVYFKSEPLFPSQGIHLIHDIEVDGEAQASLLVMDPEQDVEQWTELPRLARAGHVRGTYDVSGIKWEVDASEANEQPSRIQIGGADSDPWVEGRDAMTGVYEQNRGNYGVFYDITIRNAGKAAIALVPRGGLFKGALEYEGNIILMPKSGIINPGTAYLIDRTEENKKEVHLKISPPSGSFLPFDILIYPLDDRK